MITVAGESPATSGSADAMQQATETPRVEFRVCPDRYRH